MSTSQPPTAETIQRKTDSLRPGEEPEHLEPGEVTGVIDLALERLQAAQQATTSALESATERMRDEARRAMDLARRLSMNPPKP